MDVAFFPEPCLRDINDEQAPSLPHSVQILILDDALAIL